MKQQLELIDERKQIISPSSQWFIDLLLGCRSYCWQAVIKGWIWCLKDIIWAGEGWLSELLRGVRSWVTGVCVCVCVCVCARACVCEGKIHSVAPELLCPLVSLHPLQHTHLSVCLTVCVCVCVCVCVSLSLSLPVSCALFQGWGLRHTFHLAYEALILFRAWSERERGRKKGGERDVDVGGGRVEWGRPCSLSLPLCLTSHSGSVKKKFQRRGRRSWPPFYFYLSLFLFFSH